VTPVGVQHLLGEELVFRREIGIHGHERLHQLSPLERTVAVSPEDDVLEDGPELSHVASPWAPCERRHEPGIELGDRDPRGGTDLSEERQGDGFDVSRSLPKGRKVNRGTAKAIEEVLAKLTSAHHLGEVAVGGGDDPHVHRLRSRAPDGADLARFEGSEELNLNREGGVSDLVEEERSPGRALEEAGARVPWARELYGHRKTQGERPFAEIKAAMGFRRFALRGLAKVRGDWDPVCADFNLRRLMARAAEA
jgi:hypothetical protein